jgi:hypothetical protein
MNKKLIYCLALALALIVTAARAHAQGSEEGRMFAKTWLSINCVEAGKTVDLDGFAKYKEELKACFLSAVQRGLELEGMRDEETALGQTYDRNLKMLNENKPAWITPEYESKIRSVTKEAFVSQGKEALAKNYQARALEGLELLKSLPSK